jgi:hypothetical protein
VFRSFNVILKMERKGLQHYTFSTDGLQTTCTIILRRTRSLVKLVHAVTKSKMKSIADYRLYRLYDTDVRTADMATTHPRCVFPGETSRHSRTFLFESYNKSLLPGIIKRRQYSAAVRPREAAFQTETFRRSRLAAGF